MKNDNNDIDIRLNAEALGELIETARRDYSQRDIAKKARLSNSTIARLERGEQVGVRFENLYKLSKVLNLNLFQMIEKMYPKIHEEYKDILEIVAAFDFLSLKDRNALLDFTRALVLYRKVGSDIEFFNNLPQGM